MRGNGRAERARSLMERRWCIKCSRDLGSISEGYPTRLSRRWSLRCGAPALGLVRLESWRAVREERTKSDGVNVERSFVAPDFELKTGADSKGDDGRIMMPPRRRILMPLESRELFQRVRAF